MAVKALFLIPAFQAARTLGGVLDALRVDIRDAELDPPPPILVVDDGSTDDTAAIAASRGATVTSHPQNLGKGAALRSGLAWAKDHGFDVVVTLDADGQHPPREAVRLMQHPSAASTLLIGTRDLRAAQAPYANRLSNAFSNLVLSLFAGLRLEDTQSGLRRYPVLATLALDSRAERFAFESDVLLRAARAGLPILHVPFEVLYPADRTSHFQASVDPWRIVASVLTTTFTTRPRAKRGSRAWLLSGAPLAIALTPPGQSPELLEALLRACSEAAVPRQCSYASADELATVEVSWTVDLSTVSIRFIDRRTASVQDARTMSFVDEDPELERFRAVGYAVGTFAQHGSADASPKQASSETSGEPPRPARSTPPKASRRSQAETDPNASSRREAPARAQPPSPPPTWMLDVVAQLGTSYDGTVRVGPGLGLVAQRFLGPLDLALRGSYEFVPSFEADSARLSGDFWAAALHVGATSDQGPWSLGVELGPFIEQATLSGAGLSSATATLFGGSGLLWSRFAVGRHLRVLGGLEVGLRSGNVEVTLDNTPTLTLSPLFAGLKLGVSLASHPPLPAVDREPAGTE